MKKKLLGLVAASLLTLTLAACGGNGGNSSDNGDGENTPAVVTYYNVAFTVDGARHATARVKSGEKITQSIATPQAPEGKRFVGWFEGTTQVDLATYVVTHDATLTAKFEDIPDEGPTLSVDDVKEAGQEYYLVLGWWECTDVKDDGSPKLTSYLTKTDVRTIYKNIRTYLTVTGTTDAELEKIQFRNYSSLNVGALGTAVNADDDVDLLFGVGNNINSSTGAAVSLYNSSNDYKFQAKMGSTATARFVAATSKATEKGVALYSWLKSLVVSGATTAENTNVALVQEMTEQQVRDSLPPESLDITVTIHGDTDAVTVLEKVDDPITLATITPPTGKHFVGYALTLDGEVALNKASDAALTYNDIKTFVTNKAVDLYPVFEQDVVVEEDLVVYVQVNGNNLTMAEAKLLEARFKETLTDEDVKFNIVDGAAAAFTEAVGNDADVVIGGNNPVNNMNKHAEGPTANAGAKHFASTNRKVIIAGTCNAEHLTLAKKLYTFVTADAPQYEMHATYWPKNDNSWVSESEITTITAAMEAEMKTYLGVGAEEALLDKYNVKLTTVNVSTNTDSGKDKVADLGAATRALREGKGTDLIIGCGNNVDSKTGAGMTIVAKKTIPTTMVAGNRYVAQVTNNPLAADIYETYFPTPDAA